MATTAEKTAKVAQTKDADVSLLDQAIGATKQTEPDRAKELLRTLTEQALEGTVTYSKNLTVTFNKAIALLDQKLSGQLNAIIHDPKFLKLEGTWRGLHHLVMNSETSAMLSQTFKKLYENEFGTPGGEPYGALIGDYEFSNHPEDVELLGYMSNVAAASFAPSVKESGQGKAELPIDGVGPFVRPVYRRLHRKPLDMTQS